jgi:hypothetical protein
MHLLPDELHCAIASHLSLPDLATYRLISQRHASIGAELLFKNFLFRPTIASLERMSMILASDMKQHVKVLDYEGETTNPDPDPEVEVMRFRDVVIGFVGAGAPIDALGALNLRFEMFLPGTENIGFTLACINLTVFDVRFDCRGLNWNWNAQDEVGTAEPQQTEHSLRAFLACLKNLESLALGFRTPVSLGDQRRIYARHLCDVIPLDVIWRRMRTLQVEDVCAAEMDLMALLSNCASTLRCFYFLRLTLYNNMDEFNALGVEGLDIQPEWRKGVWRRIFERFESMESLRHGSIHEYLKNERDNEEEWKIQANGKDVVIETNLRMWLVDE